MFLGDENLNLDYRVVTTSGFFCLLFACIFFCTFLRPVCVIISKVRVLYTAYSCVFFVCFLLFFFSLCYNLCHLFDVFSPFMMNSLIDVVGFRSIILLFVYSLSYMFYFPLFLLSFKEIQGKKEHHLLYAPIYLPFLFFSLVGLSFHLVTLLLSMKSFFEHFWSRWTAKQFHFLYIKVFFGVA